MVGIHGIGQILHRSSEGFGSARGVSPPGQDLSQNHPGQSSPVRVRQATLRLLCDGERLPRIRFGGGQLAFPQIQLGPGSSRLVSNLHRLAVGGDRVEARTRLLETPL